MTKLSLILVTFVLFGAAAASLRRVCYYTNWAQYRNGPGKFYPENVDPSLCTHIIYAFAKMIGNKLAAFEWNDESTPWMKGMYSRFAAIKQQNPSVKLLLAVGGWNMGSAPFTRMVASASGRQEFATTTVAFLRKNGFDGLDLDWEYPANRGSPAGDKHKFTLLIQTLRDEFGRESVPSGKQPLLLSAAVAAGKDKIDTAYEIPEISRLLDFINLMTYDLHGSWEDHTGHNSPLFARSSETGNDTYLNVNWAAQYWAQKGMPREKMNIGLALYGRSFKLPYGTSDNKIGCPASGAGEAGLYTREAGFKSYYEICKKLQAGATKFYENEQKVPYMVLNDLWVGYDDPDSLRAKVDYVKQEHFGGIMVWALDLDDFSGMCGQGKYPLMNAIVSEINSNTGPVGTLPPVTFPTTTAAATTTVPGWPTTTVPVQVTTHATVYNPGPIVTTTQSSNGMHHLTPVSKTEFDCTIRNDGYYPSTVSCSNYYICAASITFRTDCHPGLVFNQATLYCDFPDHVTCNLHGSSNSQNIVPQAPIVVTTKAPIAVTTKAPTYPPWTPAPTTTTMRQYTQAPTTTVGAPNVAGKPVDFCKGKADGFYKDPIDCGHFYQCSFEVSYHEPCPTGTYFSEALQGCDWAANVPSCP